MELAIQNQVDRFTLAIDAIDRVPSLQVRGAHAREASLNEQLETPMSTASTSPKSSTGNGRCSSLAQNGARITNAPLIVLARSRG
jgi:hypothetical protein